MIIPNSDIVIVALKKVKIKVFDALAYFYAKYFVSNFFFFDYLRRKIHAVTFTSWFLLKLMKSIKRGKKDNWA